MDLCAGTCSAALSFTPLSSRSTSSSFISFQTKKDKDEGEVAAAAPFQGQGWRIPTQSRSQFTHLKNEKKKGGAVSPALTVGNRRFVFNAAKPKNKDKNLPTDITVNLFILNLKTFALTWKKNKGRLM